MADNHQVEWLQINGPRDPAWGYWRCLYKYVDPDTGEILYIGKADRCSVRERFNSAGKGSLWKWLEERGIDGTHVHVGLIDWGPGRRYSPEKLADLESLLIKRLSPGGNIMSTSSRISRPGVRLSCSGEWTHARSRFVDR